MEPGGFGISETFKAIEAQVLEGGGETVKDPQTEKALSHQKTKQSTPYSLEFYSWYLTDRGDWAGEAPSQLHRYFPQSPDLSPHFLESKECGEGHCSEIKGSACTSRGLQLTFFFLDLVAIPAHLEKESPCYL